MPFQFISFKTFNTDGPSITPASNAPTTCGKLNFLVINPNNFVLNKINAISNKYLYDINPTPLVNVFIPYEVIYLYYFKFIHINNILYV